jgi:hypothetical protein
MLACGLYYGCKRINILMLRNVPGNLNKPASGKYAIIMLYNGLNYGAKKMV